MNRSNPKPKAPSSRARLLLGLLLVAILFATFTRQENNVSASTNKSELTRWLSLAEAELKKTPCKYPSERLQVAITEQLKNNLGLFRSRAQVAPEEFLGTAIRIQELLVCHPTHTDLVLVQARNEFASNFKSKFRARYAIFRRTKQHTDRQASHQAVRSLRELTNSSDSLKSELSQIERSYAR